MCLIQGEYTNTTLCSSTFKFRRVSLNQREYLLTYKVSLGCKPACLVSFLAQVHIKLLELSSALSILPKLCLLLLILINTKGLYAFSV